MAKKILIGSVAALAAVAIILLVAIAIQPSQFRVERSAIMKASPERVFGQVNDFHLWDAWSPWA
jgi:hypothetical protein